MATQTQIDKNL